MHRLISGKDGLIWRGKLFHNRADALAHFETHGPDLGLAGPSRDDETGTPEM